MSGDALLKSTISSLALIEWSYVFISFILSSKWYKMLFYSCVRAGVMLNTASAGVGRSA